MSATHRRVRPLLPLALLLAALSLFGAHTTRAATTTVSFSVDALPLHTYTYPDGSSTVSVSIDARSGTATLTPGVAQTVQTTGSVHLSQSYDGENAAGGGGTFTRTFTVNGISHPQVQSASISAYGDEDSGYFAETLDLKAGATVTYDLGAQGKLDVTPLAYQDVSDNNGTAQTPIPYRFLLHDVPGYINISSIKISPAKVYGGAAIYGKVILTSPAPPGGLIVTLSTDASPDATLYYNAGLDAVIPATVFVRPGVITATFPISTVAVYSDTSVSVSATAGGTQKSTSFALLGYYAFSGNQQLPNVKITAASTGTFTLTSASTTSVAIPDHNATGITSTVTPTDTGTVDSIVVGLNITHPHIADLVITLQGPDGTTVFLQNRGGGTQKNLQSSYPVLNVPVDSLSAFSGKPVQGTWKLTVKDAAGGNVGTLNGWSLTFTYAGTLSRSLTTGSSVGYGISGLKEGTYTVTPYLRGNSFTPASRTITVGPAGSPPNPVIGDFQAGPAVIGIQFARQDYLGGSAPTGTVVLNVPASSGGLRVALSSADPSLVSVPASVTVAAGQTTATFTATTHPPPSGTAYVTLKASGGGTSYSFNLFVDPDISAVSVSPGTVTGGTGVTGKATLTGNTGADVTVLLQSSNPAVASVPSSVTVHYYGASATFPITTHAVGASTTVTLTATTGAVTKTVHLTVTP